MSAMSSKIQRGKSSADGKPKTGSIPKPSAANVTPKSKGVAGKKGG